MYLYECSCTDGIGMGLGLWNLSAFTSIYAARALKREVLPLALVIRGAGSRTCPANDQKPKHRADLHGHYADLAFSRRRRRGWLGVGEIP